MLRELSIENLAVIEKASIAFDDKLNVFTGETGAGKSILIGGINAILGGRVSKDIVRAGTEKAVVTGLLTIYPKASKINSAITVLLSMTSFYCSVIFMRTVKAQQE